ncbi:MAG: TIM barrel protein [Bacillota bacterium]
MDKYGLGWAQIFLGNPRSYNPGDPTIERVKNTNLDLNFVVHSPYIINIVNEKKDFYNRSIECIVEALDICHDLNIGSYVTHLGSVESKTSSKEVVARLKKSCSEILARTAAETTTKLLLETSPGSKSETRIGRLEELIAVAQDFSSRVGVCLDTEHAYANGLDLTKLDLEKKSSEIEVVHLNAIPEDVGLNSHRDKHGKTRLVNTKETVRKSLQELIQFFAERDVPLILERSGKEIINSDLDYLGQLLNC